MKYFSPSYWFKLWLLSAQLFSDQTKSVNAMLIDKNKDIKNWSNKNSNSLDWNFLQLNFTNLSIENIINNQFMINQDTNIEQLNQTNLDLPRWDQNLTQLKTHKIRHKKRKNRVKRQYIGINIDSSHQSIAVDNDGGAWFLTTTGKLYWFGNNQQHITNNAYLLPNINIPITSIALVTNPENTKPINFFLGTDNGAYYRRYDNEVITKISGLDEAIYSVSDKIKSRKVRGIRDIFTFTNSALMITQNGQEYSSSFERIIEQLIQNSILRVVVNFNLIVPSTIPDNRIFTLNTENYGYFRLPVDIFRIVTTHDIDFNTSFGIELVFRTDNFYLEGIIWNSEYYHFDFRNIIIERQPVAVRDNTVPHLTQIEGLRSVQLTGIRPDYIDLLPNMNDLTNININWQTIYDSFWQLLQLSPTTGYQPREDMALALGRVIFATAEAFRFRNIFFLITNNIIQLHNTAILGFRENENYKILISWSTGSRNFNMVLDNNIDINDQNIIDISTERTISDFLRDRAVNTNVVLIPITRIYHALNQFNVRILIGSILRNQFNAHNQRRVRGRNFPNCRNRKKRDVLDYWSSKFCEVEKKFI